MFAVVRHPDIEALGVVPQSAFAAHQARGFYRVSDWRDDPNRFHLSDYTDGVDLDAPEPEPAKKPAQKSDEESSE